VFGFVMEKLPHPVRRVAAPTNNATGNAKFIA